MNAPLAIAMMWCGFAHRVARTYETQIPCTFVDGAGARDIATIWVESARELARVMKASNADEAALV